MPSCEAVRVAAAVRDVQWSTFTCTLGWPTRCFPFRPISVFPFHHRPFSLASSPVHILYRPKLASLDYLYRDCTAAAARSGIWPGGADGTDIVAVARSNDRRRFPRLIPTDCPFCLHCISVPLAHQSRLPPTVRFAHCLIC